MRKAWIAFGAAAAALVIGVFGGGVLGAGCLDEPPAGAADQVCDVIGEPHTVGFWLLLIGSPVVIFGLALWAPRPLPVAGVALLTLALTYTVLSLIATSVIAS